MAGRIWRGVWCGDSEGFEAAAPAAAAVEGPAACGGWVILV